MKQNENIIIIFFNLTVEVILTYE